MAVVTYLDDTLVLGNGDPNPPMLELLLKAQADGERIIVVSGRSDTRLSETEQWLEDNGLNVEDTDVHLSDFPQGPNAARETVREARDMAKGIVSDDKWVRVAAWIARHRIDWEEVPRNNDPSVDGFPGAGAVAAYLWGVDPTSPDSADRVIAFAKQAAGERVKEDDMEEVRSVGDPDEKTEPPAPTPIPASLVTRFSQLYGKEV